MTTDLRIATKLFTGKCVYKLRVDFSTISGVYDY